jgi:hypothetical protein
MSIASCMPFEKVSELSRSMIVGGITSLCFYAGPVAAEMRLEGMAQGVVGGQRFQLPIIVTIDEPLPGENNPIHVFIGVGQEQDIGSIALYSALPFNTSSGPVTLQYFSIQASDSGISGILTNPRQAEAAMANIFRGPNIAALTAPPIMQEVYRDVQGPSEMFAALGNSSFLMAVGNDGLIYGEINATGQGLINIFPAPDVVYQANFVVRQTN